jgi:hypothetical protein
MGELRRIRHDLRGCIHGMKLCVSALETPLSDAEKVEFLTDIEAGANKMLKLMDQLHAAAPDPVQAGV